MALGQSALPLLNALRDLLTTGPLDSLSKVSSDSASVLAASRAFEREPIDEWEREERAQATKQSAAFAQDARAQADYFRKLAELPDPLPGWDEFTTNSWKGNYDAWAAQLRGSRLRDADHFDGIARIAESSKSGTIDSLRRNHAWDVIRFRWDEHEGWACILLEAVKAQELPSSPEHARSCIAMFRRRHLAVAILRAARSELAEAVEQLGFTAAPIFDAVNADFSDQVSVDKALRAVAARLDEALYRQAKRVGNGRRAKASSQRGRKRKYDPERDAASYRQWESSDLSEAEFAREKGLDPKLVRNAHKRHRKRLAAKSRQSHASDRRQAPSNSVGRKSKRSR